MSEVYGCTQVPTKVTSYNGMAGEIIKTVAGGEGETQPVNKVAGKLKSYHGKKKFKAAVKASKQFCQKGRIKFPLSLYALALQAKLKPTKKATYQVKGEDGESYTALRGGRYIFRTDHQNGACMPDMGDRPGEGVRVIFSKHRRNHWQDRFNVRGFGVEGMSWNQKTKNLKQFVLTIDRKVKPGSYIIEQTCDSTVVTLLQLQVK